MQDIMNLIVARDELATAIQAGYVDASYTKDLERMTAQINSVIR